MSTDVEAVDAEVILTEREAKDITTRIRQWVNDFPVDDIKAAFTGRIWIALGYDSWVEYLDSEFDFAGRLRLPALERVEAVAALSESGMSEVAVAETLGISRNTVRKDKAAQPVQTEQVVGKDGRTRRKPPKSNVVPLFKPDLAEVRRWAEANGIAVSARGRVRADVIELFNQRDNESVMSAITDDHFGHPNSKKQVRALNASVVSLKGCADGLTTMFASGFEKSCTPEVRAAAAADMRQSLALLEAVVSKLVQQ